VVLCVLPWIFSEIMRTQKLCVFCSTLLDSEHLPHVLRKYEALRRVNLLKSSQSQSASIPGENVSVFTNLDTPVSELGDNFSTG